MYMTLDNARQMKISTIKQESQSRIKMTTTLARTSAHRVTVQEPSISLSTNTDLSFSLKRLYLT